MCRVRLPGGTFFVFSASSKGHTKTAHSTQYSAEREPHRTCPWRRVPPPSSCPPSSCTVVGWERCGSTKSTEVDAYYVLPFSHFRFSWTSQSTSGQLLLCVPSGQLLLCVLNCCICIAALSQFRGCLCKREGACSECSSWPSFTSYKLSRSQRSFAWCDRLYSPFFILVNRQQAVGDKTETRQGHTYRECWLPPPPCLSPAHLSGSGPVFGVHPARFKRHLSSFAVIVTSGCTRTRPHPQPIAKPHPQITL